MCSQLVDSWGWFCTGTAVGFFICSSCIRQRSRHWHRREINTPVLLEDISLCSALQKSSTGFFALGHPRPSGRERGCKKTEPLSPALRSRSANPQAAFRRYLFCPRAAQPWGATHCLHINAASHQKWNAQLVSCVSLSRCNLMVIQPSAAQLLLHFVSGSWSARLGCWPP